MCVHEISLHDKIAYIRMLRVGSLKLKCDNVRVFVFMSN